MTASYRMRGLGWFLAVVVVVLGFYLVSLQVAAERKKVDEVDRAIAQTQRGIRALETEFGTRANLAQLERWNGSVLALAAPTADQFLPDEVQLAQIDFRPGMRSVMPTAPDAIRTASYVVPSLPVDADAQVEKPAPAAEQVRSQPTVALAAAHETVVARPVAASVARPVRPVVLAISAPARAPTQASTARGGAVAMLDRKMLADHALADLLERAQIHVEDAR